MSHSPHTLDIVYPSGSSCSSGGTWSIIIRMYCSVRNSSSHPHWVSTTGCEIHFDWPTSILCVGQSEVSLILLYIITLRNIILLEQFYRIQ